MEISESTQRFVGILQKIPMFQRLSPAQALEILKICRPSSFSDREIVCEFGSKSTEMYILLSGKLVVNAADGTPLTHLTPITTVGEMGVMTGEPRSATVIADMQASGFVISKIKFEVLIKKYPDIGFAIYRNTIQTLSGRLNETNKQLISCQHDLAQLRSGEEAAVDAESTS